MRRNVTTRRAARALIVVMGATLPARGTAQGCEPIRFTSPVSLGGEDFTYHRRGEWELTIAYRRLESTEWFIGRQKSSSLAPGGRSPIFKINTLIADVAYAVDDRFRVRLSLPMSKASFSRVWADNAFHEQTTTGIGDATLTGEGWLFAPRNHRHGNIALGVGVKAPTGSHRRASQFYTATGAVDFPADQTIQPGDGGWALILQGQGFRRLTDRTSAYASGSYMVSPKARSDVRFQPNSATYWAVPDVYSARLGMAVAALPDQGLTVNLGGRVDGIPIRDLFGGGDDSTIKRTSYVVFADPGLSFTRGSGTLTLSVPYRLMVNRQKSLLERRTSGTNGGGFARYLVFASYAHRL